MMDPYEIARRLAVIRLLTQQIAEERSRLDELCAQLPAGSSLPAVFAGQRAGVVSLPVPATYAKETDKRLLTAWVAVRFPTEVAYPSEPVINPAFLDRLRRSVKQHGGWLDEATGNVEQVPGLRRETGSTGTPRVTLSDNALRVVGEAHRRGEIDLGAMLAIPPGDDETPPP